MKYRSMAFWGVIVGAAAVAVSYISESHHVNAPVGCRSCIDYDQITHPYNALFGPGVIMIIASVILFLMSLTSDRIDNEDFDSPGPRGRVGVAKFYSVERGPVPGTGITDPGSDHPLRP